MALDMQCASHVQVRHQIREDEMTDAKMTRFEVKNRFTGAVQFTAEIECGEDASVSVKLGLAVKWAIKTRRADLADANLAGAYLARANLARANLAGAYLAGAYLIDGGQRSDGYRFVGAVKDNALMIHAGCRNFTITEARAHWTKTRAGTPLGDETFCILDHIEAVARIRGLVNAMEKAA